MTPYLYYLAYHECVHALIALPVAWLSFLYFGRRGLWVVVASTFLIDADHLVDLLVAGIGSGGIIVRLHNGEIFAGVDPFLFLHGFEIALLLALLGRLLVRYRWLFYPASAALAYHYLVDIVSYYEKGVGFGEYSLIWKILR